MDNQGSNMFSNMIQPNSIPEVKDNNMGQTNTVNNGMNQNMGFNTFNQSVGMTNNLSQDNVVNGNSFVPNNNVVNNNQSIPNNQSVVLNPVVPNQISGEQTTVSDISVGQTIVNNTQNLDFAMPGEINNNINVNDSSLNSGIVADNTSLETNNVSLNEAVNNNNNIAFDLAGVSAPGTNDIPNNNVNTIASVEQNNNLTNNSALENNNALTNNMNSLSDSQTSQQQVNNTELKPQIDNNNVSNDSEVVSVKKYLGYIVLFSIPVVGIIMLIVKALDKKDKNISNFAKAQLLLSLIITVIVTVLSIAFAGMIATVITGAFNERQNNTNDGYVDYDDDFDDEDNIYDVDYDDNYYDLMD